jgi:hypothetical protein
MPYLQKLGYQAKTLPVYTKWEQQVRELYPPQMAFIKRGV